MMERMDKESLVDREAMVEKDKKAHQVQLSIFDGIDLLQIQGFQSAQQEWQEPHMIYSS